MVTGGMVTEGLFIKPPVIGAAISVVETVSTFLKTPGQFFYQFLHRVLSKGQQIHSTSTHIDGFQGLHK
jgi:hypothetical protein